MSSLFFFFSLHFLYYNNSYFLNLNCRNSLQIKRRQILHITWLSIYKGKIGLNLPVNQSINQSLEPMASATEASFWRLSFTTVSAKRRVSSSVFPSGTSTA